MPTINISVTVPTDVVQAINAWRAKNTVDDGKGQGNQVPKYPNNMALLKDIIKQKIIQILDQQPTTDLQVELTAIKVAKTNIRALKDGSVT